MEWKDVIGKISAAAPMVGTLLGGPLGGAIGGVVQLVAQALGCEPKEEAITLAIQNNPEALLKLKELELTHKIELEKLILQGEQVNLEKERGRLADVQNARQREIEQTKVTGKKDVNLYVLAWLIVLGFFGLTASLLYCSYCGFQIQDNTGVLFMLLGTLATGFGMVLQYFFGSSSGSTAKTDIIATMGGVRK